MKKGSKLTIEQKQKISEATKKAMAKPEVILKISPTWFKKGVSKLVSEETRLKMSISKKGHKNTEEHNRNISLSKKGKIPKNIDIFRTYWKGKKHKPETIEKIRQAHLGVKMPQISGEKNGRWRGGSNDKHKGNEYNHWRISVYKRDSFKCKINNEDCNGKIEAHHILGWEEYPELRFNINNGITLCHFHHPRKRIDEIKLIQTLNGLVMQMN